MIGFLVAFILLNSSADIELLNEVSDRYSSADGIQWDIESVIYSDIFEEYDTTLIKFKYYPPDTFLITSKLEKIAGIDDTIWVLSQRHKQIQKKLTDGSVMPYNFILSWSDNYNLESHHKSGYNSVFELKSKGAVFPENLFLVADEENRILKVRYQDSKGDDVTMVFKKEKLKRPSKFDKFYIKIPDDFEFLDLTE